MAVGDALSHGAARVVDPVEAMHRHIAGRWFDRLAPLGRPVQVGHDSIVNLVYGSIRLGVTMGGVVIDACLGDDQERAIRTQAFVDGLWGDRRTRLGMSLRDAAGDPLLTDGILPLETEELSGRLVVLVHGLVETEERWHSKQGREGLLDALSARPHLTTLTVRYNTGEPVAANGAELAELLEAVHAGWPVPFESVSLVGHSMGGLVVRAACAAATEAGHNWIDATTDVVTIGTPHSGTPLGRLAAFLARSLRSAPVTQPLAAFLDGRSRGIRDLETGVAESLLVPGHVRQRVIAGVVTAEPSHPMGAMVGDLMVRPSSATGDGTVQPIDTMVLGGVHHFDLLHDEEVIRNVLEWVDGD